MSRSFPFVSAAPPRAEKRLQVLAAHLVSSADGSQLKRLGDESMFADEAGNSLFLQTMRKFHADTPLDLGVATYGSFRPGEDGGIKESIVYFVTKPSQCQKVLEASTEHYLWGGLKNASVAFFGERVLFVLEGKEWSDMRQTMRPVLMPNNVPVFTDTLARVGAELMAKLGEDLTQPHDLLLAFQVYHVQAASKGFYTTGINAVATYPQKTPFQQSFDTMLEQLGLRAFTQDLDLMLDYDTSNEANNLWKSNKKVVHDEVFKALQPRLQPNAKQEPDLLADLTASYVAEFGDLSAEDKMEILGANLVELFFAGYNTVVNTLGNAVVLLSQNSEVLRKLQEQLDAVLGARELPTEEDIEKMPYLSHVFFETLRLYSPVPVIARRVMEPIDLENGVVLPTDAEVMFPCDAIQHSSSHWPEPEAFRPERWEQRIEPGSWLPFSAGPRRCLGQHYARLFFSVCLSMLVRKFDFKPAPGYKHELRFTGFGSTPFCANEGVPTVKMILSPRSRP